MPIRPTLDQLTKIDAALGPVYQTWDKFATALGAIGRDANAKLRLGLSYERNRYLILQDAAADAWLLAFIDHTLSWVDDDAVRAVRQMLVPSAVPAGIECFDVCRLSGSYLLVNRINLRTALRNMLTPNGKRILMVSGDSKTGKTHSTQLISYVARMLESFKPTFVDLEDLPRLRRQEERNLPVQPMELGERIVKRMKLRMEVPPEPKDAQWARWVMDFCDSFEDEIGPGAPHWLVIDGFNAVLVSDSALDLVKELAKRVNLTLADFRLVLLGYTHNLPMDLRGIVEAESTARLTSHELIEFLAAAYDQAGRTPTDQELFDAVERILEKVDLTDPEALVKLGPAAFEELLRIAA